MTKRKLEKIRKQYEELDYSRWHILGYDELLKINGGSSASSDDDESDEEESFTEEDSGKTTEDENAASTVENPADDMDAGSGKASENEDEEDFHVTSHAEAAGMQAGDTITRSDGSEYTLNEGDVKYEQEYCNSHGIEWGNEEKQSGTPQDAPDPESELPEEEESYSSSDDADTAEQGALSGDGKNSSTEENSKSDSRQNDGAAEGKSNEKEGSNSSKENGSAKESNSGKESSNTKENASNSKKSDSPDLVERARQRDEELSARKNSELNTPKGTNSFKSAINSVKEVFDNVKKDPGTLSGFTSELAKSASKVGGKTNLSALSPTAPLMNYSGKLSTFGGAIALVDIVQNGQKERQDVIDGKQSVAHAIYNTVTHGVSVGAGFVFGAAVTTAATASTVGIGSIPGITAGIIAGSSVSTGCEKLFDIIEDKIW